MEAADREEPSTAVTTGLGIALGALTPRLRRPCSFDEESLRPRHWSYESSVVSTAPLLSSRTFGDWTPGPSRGRRGGSGSRERGSTASRNDSESVVDRPSTLTDGQDDHSPSTGGIAGVLESVQAVVEFIAGRLVKMGHDEITDGAEAGLLLPFNDRERESAVNAIGEF